jgi:hypothetical protein
VSFDGMNSQKLTQSLIDGSLKRVVQDDSGKK